MRTIGLLGGTSWHSTLEYYRLMNQFVNEKLGEKVNPPLILYNLNQAQIHALQQENKWKEISQIYIEVSRKLIDIGAEALLFCANTPHKVVDEVQAAVNVSFLHIAEATGAEAHARAMKRLGLMGTLFTMEGTYISGYIENKYGIEVITPPREVRVEMHRRIVEELCHGDFSEKTEEWFLREIEQLKKRGADGIIMGCTEIPLLLRERESPLPLLDTVVLHARYAAAFVLS